MNIRKIAVRRTSVISRKPYAAVVSALEGALGRPDMKKFQAELHAAPDAAALERIVGAECGPSGLIEFARYDLGEVLRAAEPGAEARVLRLVAGNPLIMKEMVKRVPDAGSYAPLTILIDERPDGVHLSYDSMESLLAPYGDAEASRVARELDAKLAGLLKAAAGG